MKSLLQPLLLFGLITMFLTHESMACSCNTHSVQEGVESSDVVVRGDILESKYVQFIDRRPVEVDLDTVVFTIERPVKRIYTVMVREAYKGSEVGDTLRFLTGLGGGDCGITLKEGEDYLIYGYDLRPAEKKKEYQGKEIIYNTSICTRTTKFSYREKRSIIEATRNKE